MSTHDESADTHGHIEKLSPKAREQIVNQAFASSGYWRRLLTAWVISIPVLSLAIIFLSPWDKPLLLAFIIVAFCFYMVLGFMVGRAYIDKAAASYLITCNHLTELNKELGFVNPDDECCQFHTLQAKERVATKS